MSAKIVPPVKDTEQQPQDSEQFSSHESQDNSDKITSLENEISELKNEIEELNEKNNELKDLSLRTAAEKQNIIKRTDQEVTKARKYGSQKLLADIIPVIDSLELGIKNAEDENEHTEGMIMTLSILMKILEKHGVKQINPENEEFNPEFHEAMSTISDNNVKPDTIVTVLQKGYLLEDRIIRAARVIVAK